MWAGPKLERGPSLAVGRKPRHPWPCLLQGSCGANMALWATSLSPVQESSPSVRLLQLRAAVGARVCSGEPSKGKRRGLIP